MRALATACAGIAAMALYRAWFIESPEWGAKCAEIAPPLACVPRQALLWLQNQYGFGLAALVVGVAALLRPSVWLGAAGIAAGGIALVNYNATWGMVGAALGAWTWLEVAPGWSRR